MTKRRLPFAETGEQAACVPVRKIMSDEKIVLVARLKVRENAIEEAKAAALSITEESRAEKGNINYDIHQAIDDPTVFVWHETWVNKAAIDEHFETDFFKDFYAKVSAVAAEPPMIIMTKMLTEKV